MLTFIDVCLLGGEMYATSLPWLIKNWFKMLPTRDSGCKVTTFFWIRAHERPRKRVTTAKKASKHRHRLLFRNRNTLRDNHKWRASQMHRESLLSMSWRSRYDLTVKKCIQNLVDVTMSHLTLWYFWYFQRIDYICHHDGNEESL